MENLNVNVVIRKKQNELTDLFFKNHNSIESSKLKEPIKLGKLRSLIQIIFLIKTHQVMRFSI